MGKPKLTQRPHVQRVCLKCGGEEHMEAQRCAWCESKELRLPQPGEQVIRPRYFIARGLFNSWGTGISPAQAGSNLLKNWPRNTPHKGATVSLWDCPRGAYVNIKGEVVYTKGDPSALGGPPKIVLTKTL